jgi:hypothetical protein
MHREPAAIFVISPVAQKVKELRIHQRGEKIKGVVRIGNNHEQGGSGITQSIQLHFVVGRDIPDLLNVERGQPCTAGNQDAFCGFARDELSRTFSSKRPCNGKNISVTEPLLF